MSVDPHHFNYPTLTPYAYVANNPVNLIDPDGRDIYVTGEGAEDFVSALQARTKLNVVRDESTGRISFEGKAKKKRDKLLVSISEDDKVDVIIDAVKNTDYVPGTDGDGRFTGGAHIGTSLSNGRASSKQRVNTDVLESLSQHFNGQYDFVLHELAVAYGAGVETLINGQEKSLGRDEGVYEVAKSYAAKISPQAPEDKMHRKFNRFDDNIYIQGHVNSDGWELPPTKINAKTGKRSPWNQK